MDELERIERVIAEDEGQVLRLRNELQEFEDKARSAEPIAQIVMESVEDGLRDYVKSHGWGRTWDPAREAALRALGLVQRGTEAHAKTRSDSPALEAANLHEWVWSAARPMWDASSYSTAVLHAAQSINARLQKKLGRRDESDGKLCVEAFSLDEAKPGRPRLRFIGDRSSQTWRSLQEGAGSFGRGCFAAIRNPKAHELEHSVTTQEALEELSALSRLARWIDGCSVEACDPGDQEA